MITRQLTVTLHTLGKLRQRYLDLVLDLLVDEPRPGNDRTLSNLDVDRVLALTLESTPTDDTHWSARSMARIHAMSSEIAVSFARTIRGVAGYLVG